MNNTDKYDDELDLLRYVGVFIRYWYLIIIITGSISFIGLLYLFVTGILPPEKSMLPDVFTPTALILVNERTVGDSLGALISGSTLTSSMGIKSGFTDRFSYGRLAIKLLFSRDVIDKIVEDFKIDEKYKIKKNMKTMLRNIIKGHLRASYDEDTMIVTISYIDYDPYFASNIVNRLIEVLNDKFIAIGGYKNALKKDLLETKMVDVESEISVLEAKIQQFQKKYGVLDIQSLAVEHVTMMARFRSQLILKEMEIKTYSDFSKIEDAVLKRLKAERGHLINLIEEFESGFSEYQGIFPAQKELPAISQEFEHIQRDLRIQEAIHETLVKQYEIIKLALEGEESIFQVIEKADVPDLETSPRRSRLFFMITGIGFIVSLVVVVLVNIINTIRKDPERLKRLFGEKQKGMFS
ncbi:MAG: hypothetical protein JXJ04_26865 [Spirochaetales bacterium]|nr:hypothetical protein [Spirochaetales bacterium]